MISKLIQTQPVLFQEPPINNKLIDTVAPKKPPLKTQNSGKSGCGCLIILLLLVVLIVCAYYNWN